MYPSTRVGVCAVAAAALAIAPSAAVARGHHHRFRDAPSRVASRLQHVERSLARAQAQADDGRDDAANASLAQVRRDFGAAVKSAVRHTTAADDFGVPADEAVAFVAHEVITEAAAMFDGSAADLDQSISQTVTTTVLGRETVVGAIAGLDADTIGDYSDVLDSISTDVSDELDNLGTSLTDDTLSDAGTATLQVAITHLNALDGALGTLQDAIDANSSGDYPSTDGSADDGTDDSGTDGAGASHAEPPHPTPQQPPAGAPLPAPRPGEHGGPGRH